MEQTQNQESEVLHTMDTPMEKTPLFTMPVILILLASAILGLGTGYIFASSGGKINTVSVSETPTAKDQIEVGKTYGSTDQKIFKDDAKGKLAEGGINGEGEYHLVRPGGDSQNIYLSSSTLDLSIFVGKEIQIWGQTYDGQSAGWLMDVGRVQVIK